MAHRVAGAQRAVTLRGVSPLGQLRSAQGLELSSRLGRANTVRRFPCFPSASSPTACNLSSALLTVGRATSNRAHRADALGKIAPTASSSSVITAASRSTNGRRSARGVAPASDHRAPAPRRPPQEDTEDSERDTTGHPAVAHQVSSPHVYSVRLSPGARAQYGAPGGGRACGSGGCAARSDRSAMVRSVRHSGYACHRWDTPESEPLTMREHCGLTRCSA